MTDDPQLILTPTARLARAENQRLAQRQVDAGLTAWHKQPVLSFTAWLNQLRDDWFLLAEDDRIPINPAQALVLWQSVIDQDIFVGEPKVAELAQAAWRLIHEFELDQPETWPALWMSEDNRRFRDWAGRYRALCHARGLVDEWMFAAELPNLIREGTLEHPDQIILLGFDRPLTPVQQRLVAALEESGCTIERSERSRSEPQTPPVSRFVEPDDELLAAARWARQRVADNPDQSIGIVVPDLQSRLARVERVFRQVFDPPGFALAESGEEAWHISLGHPLAQWPLASHALLLLGLDPWRISQPQAGKLLRSPFIEGWKGEQATRSHVLARLTRFAPYWIDAREIARQCVDQGAETLAGRLAAWQGFRRKNNDSVLPSAWARRFQEELTTLGFGRGRTLDSREFQVLQRWHELLESFSELDLVSEQPLSRSHALKTLSERARSAIFRERDPGAVVEILGVEEALGASFDALWITTLDNEHWPRAARRDPLIPGQVQASLPQASASACLEQARLDLDNLIDASSFVQGSFACGSDDQPLEVTPLLTEAVVTDAESIDAHQPVELETLADDHRAPPLENGDIRGGTGVLQAQSDCPFRAYATQRLGAADLTPPRPGLDARDRGSLLHQALESFWRELPDQAALLALGGDELDHRISQSVASALEQYTRRNRLGMTPASQALEAECLKQAMNDWLDLEKQREPFRVNQLEAKIALTFGDLTLSGKIDRMDEMNGGGTLLIDYKTGQTGKNGWWPDERLGDVQLPAYAVSLEPKPAALMFARLRPEAMSFDGLAEVDPGIPGVEVIGEIKRQPFKEIESWQDLLKGWQTGLDTLAANFVHGKAEVDPRSPAVCRYCHLHSLCRINERVLPQDDEAGPEMS